MILLILFFETQLDLLPSMRESIQILEDYAHASIVSPILHFDF